MSILEHFVQLKPENKSEILITDKKVGDILIEQKLIDAHQLKQALQYQTSHPEFNGLIGDICVQLGWIKKIELIKVISEHYHIPLALAILEKREIARKMRAQNNQTQEQLDPNKVVDNDFIDSLSDFPMDQKNTSQETSRYKLQYEKAKAEREYTQDPYATPILNAPIPKLKTQNKTSQRSIIDLVLTNQLQNGLIKTNEFKEKRSVEYILNLVKSAQVESALEYIEKIRDKHQHSALFCQIEVFTLIHDFRFEQAQKCLDNFDADYMLYPELLDLQSVIHQLLDKHEEAVKNYTDLIQMKKLSSFCYFSLAYSLDQLNLTRQAKKIYKHFTSLANSGLYKQMAYARSKV